MLELLEKKRYVVKVTKYGEVDGGRGCWVRFPSPTLILPGVKELTFSYSPRPYNKKETVINTTKNGESVKVLSYETRLPNYAVRNYIGLDIYLAINQLNLSPQIIVYYDENGQRVEGLENVLPDIDAEKEGVLTQLYLSGANEGFAKYMKAAKRSGVLGGYKILAETFP